VSGAGIVIYDYESGLELWAAFQYLGVTTNNVAEYEALISGLSLANAMGIKRLIAEGDSTLVVKQISGDYNVKSEHLVALNQRVKVLSETFDSFSLNYIPRAENFRADQLANCAMDEKISMGLDISPIKSAGIHSSNKEEILDVSQDEIFRDSSSFADIIPCIPEPIMSEHPLSPFRTFVLRFGGRKKGESSIGSSAILIDDLSDEELWAGMYFKEKDHVNQFIPAYIGLIIGLRKAVAMGITRLIVESHIECVINQMSGKWKVKSEVIIPYYTVAKALCRDHFEDIDFHVIDAKKNFIVKDLIEETLITERTHLPGFIS
jgi:ribonuclease HI